MEGPGLVPHHDGNTYQVRSGRDHRQSNKAKRSIYFRRLSRAAEYPASQNHPGELECLTFGGDKPSTARRSRTGILAVICGPSVTKIVLKKIITHSGKAHFDVTSELSSTGEFFRPVGVETVDVLRFSLSNLLARAGC